MNKKEINMGIKASKIIYYLAIINVILGIAGIIVGLTGDYSLSIAGAILLVCSVVSIFMARYAYALGESHLAMQKEIDELKNSKNDAPKLVHPIVKEEIKPVKPVAKEEAKTEEPKEEPKEELIEEYEEDEFDDSIYSSGFINLNKIDKRVRYKILKAEKYSDYEIRNLYLIYSILNDAVMKNPNLIYDYLNEGIFDEYKISSKEYRAFVTKLSKKDGSEYKSLIKDYIEKIEETFIFEDVD